MAWTSIIVGVDGTAESLRAVAVAQRLATAAHAQLVPVHAVPIIPVYTGIVGIEPTPAYSPELQDEAIRSARLEISRALEALLPAAAVQRLEVETGPAPFVIAELARQRRADLVVLGGKQHGALARGLGRSTAHYLVRTLDVPLLVVGDSAGPLTKVLAAVDLSAASRATLEAAQGLARLFKADLRLLHVIEPLPVVGLTPVQWDEEGYYQRSEALFERFVAPLTDLAPEQRLLRRGRSADTIVAEARAWHADVVVVGSHGKGWVDRVLVGSTTERIVTQLPTSIFVVPVKALERTSPVRASRRPGTAASKRGVRERRGRS